MQSQGQGGTGIRLRSRRRAVSLDADALVEIRPLRPDRAVPVLVQPKASGLELRAWAAEHRSLIESLLLEHGGILFRGFWVETAEAFEDCIGVISGGALEYRYRASPRTRISGNIYTATDYPADQQIFPHNEHAYSPVAPQHIYFYCSQPAEQGGETPVASTRAVLGRLPDQIVDKFAQLGVLYVRNFGDGFGLPWQTVFQTSDRDEVAAYCAANDIDLIWKSPTRLMTRAIGPALVTHPMTGERVWFNHATFFHVTTLPRDVRRALNAQFGSMDLPQNTFYGDGSPIEAQTLETLRAAYLGSLHSFAWQRHDVMFLDNLLAVHGRNSFIGVRRVLTGMARPLRIADLTAMHEHKERL